jgi:uncharacterized protein YjaZ
MRYIHLIIGLLFICACDTDPLPKEKILKDHNKIIFLDYYYSCYLNELQKGKETSDVLYGKLLEKPIYDYFRDAEFLELLNLYTDTNGLQTVLSLIKSNESQIKNDIRESLNLCNKHLKREDLTIYVQPMSAAKDEQLQKMEGVTGVTIGAKDIILQFDPTIKGWEEALKSCVAHEFHHAYVMSLDENSGVSTNLLDYLIFEGRADAFAHTVYPQYASAWTKEERSKEIAPLWNKLKTKLQDQDYKFQREVMFGSAEWPDWTGYTLGYSIVRSCLKNKPQLSVLEWTKMKPEEILKCSDFK